MESGQRVGLVVMDYANELADFEPLAAANDERAEVVAALEAKESQQDAETEGTTTAKEEAREARRMCCRPGRWATRWRRGSWG